METLYEMNAKKGEQMYSQGENKCDISDHLSNSLIYKQIMSSNSESTVWYSYELFKLIHHSRLFNNEVVYKYDLHNLHKLTTQEMKKILIGYERGYTTLNDDTLFFNEKLEWIIRIVDIDTIKSFGL